MNELVITGAVLLVLYLVWCWVLPFKPCPSCGGNDKISDRQGNYVRYTCWRCKGARDYPRIGARLLRRHRR